MRAFRQDPTNLGGYAGEDPAQYVSDGPDRFRHGELMRTATQ